MRQKPWVCLNIIANSFFLLKLVINLSPGFARIETVVERDVPRSNVFEDPEYVGGRIRTYELQKAQKESLQKALLEQAEINFRENIHPKAREARKMLAQRRKVEKERQRKLIEESNALEIGEPDYLTRMHKMMNSRNSIERDRFFDTEHRHYHKRKRPGWGKWGHLTRAQAAQRMRDWVDQTSGAVLPYAREEHWEQLMFEENLEDIE